MNSSNIGPAFNSSFSNPPSRENQNDFPLSEKESKIKEASKKIHSEDASQEPVKLSKEILDLTKQKKPLLRNLPRKAEEIGAKIIQHEHQKIIDPARGALSPLVSLENLYLAQNPITKLDRHSYIPAQDFGVMLLKASILNADNLQEIFQEALSHIDSENIVEEQKLQDMYIQACDMLSKDDSYQYAAKTYYNQETPFPRTLENISQVIKAYIHHEIKEWSSQNQDPNFLTRLLSIVDDFHVPLNSPPIQYPKEDVLNNLRLLYESTDNEEEKESLIKAIREINQEPSSYIDENLLNQLVNPVSQQLTANLESYVSLTDISARNPDRWVVRNILQRLSEARLPEEPGYVFKTGTEIPRELLSSQILSDLGLNQYVILKTATTLSQAKLEDLESPTGIIGTWITDAEDIPQDVWDEYWKTRQTLMEGKFKGAAVEEEQKYTMVMQGLEKKLFQYAGRDSSQKHALIDILLFPYDNHIRQYKIQNREAFNFDLARFFSPNLAFILNDETYIPFRSVFIDHPFAKDPMSEDVKKWIKDINIQEIEVLWRAEGLIGDPQSFQEAADQLKTLNSEHVKVRNFSNDPSLSENDPFLLEKFANKYQVPYSENGSVRKEADIKQEIFAKIAEERQMIQQACLPFIHPVAFEQFKQRIQILKDYVTNENQPTMFGAFEQAYPLYQPFIQVLERLDPANPCTAIGHQVKQERNIPRPLEEIISEAKSKQLATADEINAMEKALEELKKYSFHPSELATMSALGRP